MAQFHFVEDYERLVASLVAQYPIEEAMSRAVGGGIGSYEAIGEIELNVVRWAGLQDGMSIIDVGCGSGRLAHAIGQHMSVDFLGVDIVQQLLDYAKTKSPANYRFVCHRELTIPAKDYSAEMVSAFSLFTHLLHAETYLYLEDARRVLRPGGKVVFSFLEFGDPGHWDSFLGEVAGRRAFGGGAHLNTMIERNAIACWANALGYKVQSIVGGTQAPWGGSALWQAVCVLQK
jgi:ubiquinone/menaquinone biosynthesis C-methylase UbiE